MILMVRKRHNFQAAENFFHRAEPKRTVQGAESIGVRGGWLDSVGADGCLTGGLG